MNNVVLVGRLTKDPELKMTQSNKPFVNFTVAVNRSFTNQDGEREADFINCVIWNRSAENLAKYQRKGSLISLNGRIQTRNYENDDGKRVFITEVVVNQLNYLSSKSDNQNSDDGYYEDTIAPVNPEDLPF